MNPLPFVHEAWQTMATFLTSPCKLGMHLMQRRALMSKRESTEQHGLSGIGISKAIDLPESRTNPYESNGGMARPRG